VKFALLILKGYFINYVSCFGSFDIINEIFLFFATNNEIFFGQNPRMAAGEPKADIRKLTI
jgi:hypothetical protein